MKLMKVLPILVVALLLAVPGFAQTGNLAGKVVDTYGKQDRQEWTIHPCRLAHR